MKAPRRRFPAYAGPQGAPKTYIYDGIPITVDLTAVRALDRELAARLDRRTEPPDSGPVTPRVTEPVP